MSFCIPWSSLYYMSDQLSGYIPRKWAHLSRLYAPCLIQHHPFTAILQREIMYEIDYTDFLSWLQYACKIDFDFITENIHRHGKGGRKKIEIMTKIDLCTFFVCLFNFCDGSLHKGRDYNSQYFHIWIFITEIWL